MGQVLNFRYSFTIFYDVCFAFPWMINDTQFRIIILSTQGSVNRLYEGKGTMSSFFFILQQCFKLQGVVLKE
jgi:hypothetical protein